MNNIKKISLYTPKNLTKNLDENLTFKKQSPAVMSREKCYSEMDNLELNPKEKEVYRTEQINNANKERSTNNEINTVEFNVHNNECFRNLVSPEISVLMNKNQNDVDININSNVIIESDKRSPNLSNKNLKVNDVYKHHRKKSSFFNSNDLRVSKQDTFKIVDKSLNKNLFNKFSVNSNKILNLIELDNDKYFNINNNDNSLVKINDSKSEISQNNINPEIITSNFTSIISFINNNNTQNSHNNINNNCNIINNYNKIIVDNMNTFDFNDSPLKQNPTNQHFLSYDNKSNINQHILVTNATKQDYHSNSNQESALSKKTKSLDLFSISNQMNVDITNINNKKLTEDKTRVNLFNKIRIL